MLYEIARYFLWVLSLVGLGLVLWRSLREARRECPLFVIYLAATLVQTGSGLYLNVSQHWLYTKTYWPSQAVLVALAFAALYEAAAGSVIRYRALSAITNRALGSVALVLAVIAIIWLAAREQNTLVASILMLEQALRLVQVGVLVLLFMLALLFRLRWSSHAFGIALGFGLYGTLDLLILELTRAGLIGPRPFVLLDPLAYNIAVMIWIAYLWNAEREPAARALPVTEISEWNKALGELLQR